MIRRIVTLVVCVAMVSEVGCTTYGSVDAQARDLANQVIHAFFIEEDEAKLITLMSPEALKQTPPTVIAQAMTKFSRQCGRLGSYQLDRGAQRSMFSVSRFRTFKQAQFNARGLCGQHLLSIQVSLVYDTDWKVSRIWFDASMF